MSLFAAVSDFFTSPPSFPADLCRASQIFLSAFSCFNHFSSATCKNELLEKLTFSNAFRYSHLVLEVNLNRHEETCVARLLHFVRRLLAYCRETNMFFNPQ